MKNRVDDANIKELIKKYKNSDEKTYDEIIKILSPYIYNYPRIAFCSDWDTCGDFYEYILVRMRDIFKAYRESEARFITWFTVVLRSRYLNFIRGNRSRLSVREQFDFLSLDCKGEKSLNLYEVISDNREYSSSKNEGFQNLVDEIAKNLDDKYRIFFHLYYLETLRPEDVGYISIFLGRSIREILSGIDEIRNSMIDKYEIKNGLLDNLNTLFYRLLKDQESGKLGVSEKIKKKRDRVLTEYRKVKLNPSYESLSRFLKIPIGTVSTGISRMKKAVKCYLKEHYHEGMPIS